MAAALQANPLPLQIREGTHQSQTKITEQSQSPITKRQSLENWQHPLVAYLVKLLDLNSDVTKDDGVAESGDHQNNAHEQPLRVILRVDIPETHSALQQTPQISCVRCTSGKTRAGRVLTMVISM